MVSESLCVLLDLEHLGSGSWRLGKIQYLASHAFSLVSVCLSTIYTHQQPLY